MNTTRESEEFESKMLDKIEEELGTEARKWQEEHLDINQNYTNNFDKVDKSDDEMTDEEKIREVVKELRQNHLAFGFEIKEA